MCPTEEERAVGCQIFYEDLSYDVLVEEDAYPLEEMINEMAGVFGIYFGFSMLSIATMLHCCFKRVNKISDTPLQESSEVFSFFLTFGMNCEKIKIFN